MITSIFRQRADSSEDSSDPRGRPDGAQAWIHYGRGRSPREV